MWMELKDKKPPFFAPWTDADEKKLMEMKKKDIKLDDTALGRLINVRKREQEAAFWSSSCKEREFFLKGLKIIHDVAEDLEGKTKETRRDKKITIAAINVMTNKTKWSGDKEDREVSFVANEAAI